MGAKNGMAKRRCPKTEGEGGGKRQVSGGSTGEKAGIGGEKRHPGGRESPDQCEVSRLTVEKTGQENWNSGGGAKRTKVEGRGKANRFNTE